MFENSDRSSLRHGDKSAAHGLHSYGIGGQNYERQPQAKHPNPVVDGKLIFDNPYKSNAGKSGERVQEARLGQNDAGSGRSAHDHPQHLHGRSHPHDDLRHQHGRQHLHDNSQHQHGRSHPHDNLQHPRQEMERKQSTDKQSSKGGGGHAGKISFYGGPTDSKWEGRKTASGREFHGKEHTIAVQPSDIKSGKYHFGEKVKVCTGSSSEHCVDATVTDTGGFSKYGRMADVSRAVAEDLGFTQAGITHATIKKQNGI